MYLLDTNVWLERILDQARSEEVGQFIDRTPADRLFITDFAFHSTGVILAKLNRNAAFLTFVKDVFLDGNVTGKAITALSLGYDAVISCVFVSTKRYASERTPLLLNVRNEGAIV